LYLEGFRYHALEEARFEKLSKRSDDETYDMFRLRFLRGTWRALLFKLRRSD
jgi:hypothetical protein